MRRFSLHLGFVLAGSLAAVGHAAPTAPAAPAASNTPPAEYREVYTSQWAKGIDPKLELIRAKPDAINASTGKAGAPPGVLAMKLLAGDDFKALPDGVPRTAISLAPQLRFRTGRDYLIQWSAQLPEDYRFDTKQPDVLAEVRQGPKTGFPPFRILLENDRYVAEIRVGDSPTASREELGSAAGDRGKWVYWSLRYVPDFTSKTALTQVMKDGKLIYDRRGFPNAYTNDDGGHFRLGIAKPDWAKRPSDVKERVVLIGDVKAWEKVVKP